MTKFVAVSKDGGDSITKNKEYPIITFDEQGTEKFGREFYIIDDDDKREFCLEFSCHQIDRNDWEIKALD